MKINANTYEEVYEILILMDKKTVMKIPIDILENIKKNRNKNFITKINEDNIFDEENVQRETLYLLCWLDYNYWMKNDRRKEIDKNNMQIYRKLEEEKKKSYNIDIFERRQWNDNEINKNVLTELIEVKPKNFFEKIIDKIKRVYNVFKEYTK